MKKKVKAGFLNLAKKSVAVITASIGALTGNDANALPTVNKISFLDPSINNELAYKRVLKPKLVLKLNISNPENSITVMHSSHRSHSSHSSHYSGSSSGHSSHSSHYSSSTYSPSTGSSYTPSSSSGSSGSSHQTSKSYKPSSSYGSSFKSYSKDTVPTKINSAYFLLTRVLVKGCQGTDVEYVQRLLILAGYVTPVAGYFGDLTKEAVMKFQKANLLEVDGKVGNQTLSLLKAKVYGN
ncbi:MAG TPA: peptidoglycan-binding domain-containing protein [Pelobium sp.]|nr:peptidoglycan-binding domain-containing protein [Pelobium sp.]